jgi:hypothetical protein
MPKAQLLPREVYELDKGGKELLTIPEIAKTEADGCSDANHHQGDMISLQ